MLYWVTTIGKPFYQKRNHNMDKQKLVKALSLITGLMLISLIIYSIVNKEWFDALGYCGIFFVIIVMPTFLKKLNKK